MVRQSLLLILLAVSVAGGGCLTESITSEPTSEPSSTFQSTACGPTLTVAQASKQELRDINRTVNFTDLPQDRQSEFRRGVEGERAALGDDWTETWTGPTIVQYEGVAYRTAVAIC